MPQIAIPGARLHVEDQGTGAPVLFVSGFGGSANYWADTIPAFTGYRTIAYDHAGIGRSERVAGPDTMEGMAADAIALLDALGISRAHLVGHSTGAAIGQIIAAHQPGRLLSATLYAPWTTYDEHLRRCMAVRRRLLDTAGIAAYVEATACFLYPGEWVVANAERIAQWDSRAIAGFPAAETINRRFAAAERFSTPETLSASPVPMLICCASDDMLTPPYFSHALAEQCPNAELVILEEGGHACSVTRAGTFNSVVLDFLARTDAA